MQIDLDKASDLVKKGFEITNEYYNSLPQYGLVNHYTYTLAEVMHHKRVATLIQQLSGMLQEIIEQIKNEDQII